MKTEGGLAYLTAEEMADTDRYAIDQLGIGVESLMENAGARTAEIARTMFGGDVSGKKVAVLAGRGNNGGDGLVAARHLHNWGAQVRVTLGEAREEVRELPARQLATVERMGMKVEGPDGSIEGADVLVDALLGYGSKGDPRGPLADLIRSADSSRIPILAVDLPSGLDATTGKPGEPCIVADTTITFGLPKTGFLEPRARGLVGKLYVADISLPRAVYERYASPGIFSKGPLLRLW